MTAYRSTVKPFLRSAVTALSLNALALGMAPAGMVLMTVAAQAQTQASIITGQAEFEALIAEGAKLIDVRSPSAYAQGHVAGAISLPWQALNVSESDGIRNEFAADAEFERLLGEAGLSYDDTILIYDTTALPGRAYVAFVYAGFENVHVLDGGIGAWQGGLTQDVPQVAATTFTLTRKNDIRVDKDYVAGKIGDAGSVIIDGRNLDAYEDGHIPGAQALPASSLLTKTATLQSQPVLQRLLDTAGVSPDREVVSYCGSGVAIARWFPIAAVASLRPITIWRCAIWAMKMSCFTTRAGTNGAAIRARASRSRSPITPSRARR